MIMVTGASGQLGSLILAELRRRGTDAAGGSRNPDSDLRYLDFDKPSSLDLAGVSTLVLVSAGYAEDDVVITRHRAAIEAAARDGVKHLIYTSLTSAGDHLAMAPAHRATERLIQHSGLGWSILRNGLYAELFGALLQWAPDRLESPFGDGGLAAVARPDLAAAAAIVASEPGAHRGRVYDLVGGPVTAANVAALLGVAHASIGLGAYRERLMGASTMFLFQPPMLVSIATSIRHGFLDATTTDLADLLGRRPADSLAIAADVAALTRA